MKYPRNKCSISNNNLISISDLSLQVGDKTSEILLFRLVIKGKDDKVGYNQKDEEKEIKAILPQSLNSPLYGIDGKKEGDEEQREKVDKIPRRDEVGDVENFTEDVSPCDGKNQNTQKDEGVFFGP
jgi:hypothetical protein